TPEEPIFAPPTEPPPPPQQLFGDAPVPGAPAAPARPSLSPGLRSFDLGEVISDTFRIYFANFVPFVILTGLAFSPVLLYTYIASPFGLRPGGMQPTGMPNLSPFFQGLAILILLQMVCGALASASVNFGVFQQLRGRDTSLVDCLTVGLRSLFPVIGVALVQGI